MWYQSFNSSAVYAVEYDPSTLRMRVYFVAGGPGYIHDGVPRSTADEFRQAESAGRYYNQVMRGRFPRNEEVA